MVLSAWPDGLPVVEWPHGHPSVVVWPRGAVRTGPLAVRADLDASMGLMTPIDGLVQMLQA